MSLFYRLNTFAKSLPSPKHSWKPNPGGMRDFVLFDPSGVLWWIAQSV
ncbi:MAG: hypothetical protein NTX57_07815 [Armatimonadetes bacterium]|nr:hypothetical protein [Armatimonadota bacterium]